MDQETELGSRHEICVLMDKLTLKLFELMEEHMQCKVNIEKRANEGNLLLAKTRYIQGTNSASINQLPTENTPEFSALVTVGEVEADNLYGKKFVVKKFPIDKEAGHLDPTKWFGVLVPRSLQFAKERYQMSIELVIESVNIQRELEYVMLSLNKLRDFKKTWKDPARSANIENISHTVSLQHDKTDDLRIATKKININDSNNDNIKEANNEDNLESTVADNIKEL